MIAATISNRFPRSSFLALLVGLIAFSLLGCRQARDTPRVSEGVLDLSEWDFEAKGIVPLEGEWEICWHAFVPAGSTDCPQRDWEFFPVPRLWSDSGVSSPIGGKGIASYRARLDLPPDSGPLTLRVGSPMTAYWLWINGEPVGGVGKLGTTAAATVPKLANRNYALAPGVSRIEILVHVANFDFRGGGLRRTWYVGLTDQIVERNAYVLMLYTAFATTTAVLGLIFLAQFAFRPSEKARGWLGLFSTLVGMRMFPGATSDLYQLVLGWVSFGALIRIEYLNAVLLIVVAAAYLRVKVPGVMPPRVTQLLLLSGLALVPIHLFAPFPVVSATLPVILILPPVLMLLAIVEYGRAYRRGLAGAGSTMVAALIFIVGILHDVIRTQTGFGASIELFPYFVVVWLVIESGSLVQSYAHAYASVEALSDELQESNFELKETEESIVRFVPFDLMQALHKKSIRDVHAGDHARMQMSVLHCGFHSIPSLNDLMSSPTSFEIANEIVGRLERCAHEHRGFMNEYRGDGVQMFFPGGPTDAVSAAIAMLAQARAFEVEAPSNNRFVLEVGIGVDTGSVLIGMIGNPQQLSKVVVGEPLDMARRLEALTTGIDANILISAATREGLGETCPFEVRAVEGLEIDGGGGGGGGGGPIELYEVL
jgi:hypothetical protein